MPAVLIAGCQQSITGRLVGDWIGRPDTAAAAAVRSAKLKARHKSDSNEAIEPPSVEEATAKLGKTDLEHHDVTIRMSLAGDKTATMSLGDGSEPLAGVWRVIEKLPPSGAEIEISLSGADDGSPGRAGRRRFIIDFQEIDEAAGFTLVEKGADPQFGRLYFTRDD